MYYTCVYTCTMTHYYGISCLQLGRILLTYFLWAFLCVYYNIIYMYMYIMHHYIHVQYMYMTLYIAIHH